MHVTEVVIESFQSIVNMEKLYDVISIFRFNPSLHQVILLWLKSGLTDMGG